MHGATLIETQGCHRAALAIERLHCVLRRMADHDWARLKELLATRSTETCRRSDLDALERVFRHHHSIDPDSAGAVVRVVQAITSDPLLEIEVADAQERLRKRVRFVLREMSDRDWTLFKAALERTLSQPTKTDDLRVLELVFRTGESISNVEIAALAKAGKLAARRLIDPEVARKNALLKAKLPGAAPVDPESAYLAAKTALEQATEIARRGDRTLAFSLVEPTAPYKHARNSIFRVVDAIIGEQELISVILTLEQELSGVGSVSREKMRWALHRMPVGERMKAIKLIPLNTVLAFHDGEDASEAEDAGFRATRDRRLAHDLFIRGQSEEELMVKYRCSLSALKSAVASILQALGERPLARKLVNDYVAEVDGIEPLGKDDVRRMMKRLSPEQRAALLNSIPPCAWKVRDLIPLHKRLFLDYLSGEWVLGALVAHYNLRGDERLCGHFARRGTLTLRGAGAAIDSLLSKIADEPALRRQLKQWASGTTAGCSLPIDPDADLNLPDCKSAR